MSLFLRGNIWWMELPNPNGGKPLRESTKSRDREGAERILAAKLTELKYGVLKTEPKGQPKTLKDALDRWNKERSDKRSIDDDIQRGKFWLEKLGDKPLKLITSMKIKEIIAALQKEKKLANGTCNRYIALITAVLNRAEQEWGWLEQAPRVSRLTENTDRGSFLEEEEIPLLAAELPELDRDMMYFALSTGLRLRNVTGVRWSWVSMSRKTLTVPSSSYKNKKPHTIPLFEAAMTILRKYEGRSAEFVFTKPGGARATYSRKKWKRACEKIGRPTFRWHDLRHTFASHHVIKGTPLNVLQVLGGWRTPTMVQRYGHLNTDALRGYENNSAVV
jgi:integrase